MVVGTRQGLKRGECMEYKLFMTKRINNVVADDEETAKAVCDAVQRFAAGDWENLPDQDKQANDTDLQNRDGHVLARYGTPAGDIYINLTFNDPSMQSDIAMIMFCDEY